MTMIMIISALPPDVLRREIDQQGGDVRHQRALQDRKVSLASAQPAVQQQRVRGGWKPQEHLERSARHSAVGGRRDRGVRRDADADAGARERREADVLPLPSRDVALQAGSRAARSDVHAVDAPGPLGADGDPSAGGAGHADRGGRGRGRSKGLLRPDRGGRRCLGSAVPFGDGGRGPEARGGVLL